MDTVKSKLGVTKSGDDKDQLIIENRDKLIKDLQVTLEMGILGSLKHKVVKIYDFKGSLWLLLTISSLIDVFVTASKMEKTFHGLMLHTFHSIIVVLCFLHLIIHDKHNDYNKLSNKILNWIDALLIAVYTLSAGIYLSTGFLALFGDISTTITDTETNNSTTVRLVDYLDAAQVDKDDPLKSLVVLMFKVVYSVKFLSREFTYKIFIILLRNYFIRALPSYGDEIVLDSNNNDRSCCKKCWTGFVNGLFMGMLAAILYLLMRQYPDTQIDFFVSLVTIYLVYLYVYLYHGVEQNEPNCSFIFGGHQAAAILYFMSRFF